MVHALRKLHTAIRPGGALLDVHPQTQMPAVFVTRPDGTRMQAGHVDWTEDNAEIRAARRRLARLEKEGLFAAGPRVRFRTADHFDSIDEWLAHRAQRELTSVVAPTTIAAARATFRDGDRLTILLRVRATLLSRVTPA